MSAEHDGVHATLASLPDLLDVIKHRARLEILVSLARSPKDVSTLATELDLAVHTISRHLRPLFGWGLVQYDRVAKRHVYRLGPRVMCTTCGDALHLLIRTSQRHQLELKFPCGAEVRWDPPTAVGRSRHLPRRSGR